MGMTGENGLWPVGTILRYNEGSTALFEVTDVSPRHDGLSKARYYGIQYFGDRVAAYHENCREPSGDDLVQWNKGASRRDKAELMRSGRRSTAPQLNRLRFDVLRYANLARLPEFKNKHGEPAHSKPDGSDWSPAQWLEAVLGELGEYANAHKKYVRGDYSAAEFAVIAAKELADVQTYLDILAARCLDVDGVAHPTGIDLGQATVDKWNEVSERVGTDLRINATHWYRKDDV